MKRFVRSYLVGVVTALAVVSIAATGAVTGEAAPTPAFTLPMIPFLVWIATGQMKVAEKYRNPWLWSAVVAVVGVVVAIVLLLV